MRRRFKPKLVKVGQLFTGDHIRDRAGSEFIVVRLTSRRLHLRKPGDLNVFNVRAEHGETIEILNN